MKILALYTIKTLPLLRRVMAPFSVLTTRGHAFSFVQVPHFDPGLGTGHDVMVLSNWILSDEENVLLRRARDTQQQRFVYDLSDPSLLENPQVQETMTACAFVSVPNEYLAKEVRIVAGKRSVVVLPSVIDVPYYMTGNAYAKADVPIVGCFGRCDWEVARTGIEMAKEKYPRVQFVGDSHATAVLGDLIEHLDPNIDTYPRILRRCKFGLLPIDKFNGEDLIIRHEYGILCKPVVLGDKGIFTQRLMKQLSLSPQQVAEQGQDAYEMANTQRATKLAHEYLTTYQQMLPLLARMV